MRGEQQGEAGIVRESVAAVADRGRPNRGCPGAKYDMIMRNSIKIVMIVTLVAGFSTLCHADIITLKNGSTYEGIIGAEDSKTIILAVPGQMPLKIQKSTIKSIEKKRPEFGITGSSSNEVDDLKFLSRGEYYDELMEVLPEAKKSIYVMMYLMNYKGKPGYPVNDLVNLLVDAHKRGVKVTVLLESASEGSLMKANRRAAKFLKKKGIDVRIYPIYPIMHVKLVLIDDYISIVGSHNWTIASTCSNIESAVLVKSKRIAKEYEQYFKKSYNRAKPYL
ncbi:MAG: phospholipase D-like domain-containing protein [Candidatus Auribacterota bacterium]|nr:phospholipase D-like domain-containing protein [Candidatus Auribacterota bacterium]